MNEIEFPLNEAVRGKNIQKIVYFPDLKKVLIWHDNKPIEVDVDLKSMSKTGENYYLVMNDAVDSKTTMENVLLILSDGLAPYMYEFAKNGNDYGYGDGDGEDRITAAIRTTTTMEEALPTSKKVGSVPGPFIDKEPLNEIPDKDYAEFVINMARRTIKQENSLVRQIFYTAMSKDTAEPLNLGIHAPTSEGKTWPVIKTLEFFPAEDIQYIGKMSTMTLVRQRGILVDSNNQRVSDKLRQLRKEIRKLKNKGKGKGKTNEVEADEQKLAQLEDELDALLEDVRTVINLKGKVIVFLEPPKPELWDLLKPFLSHDKEEIEYPFVETNPIEGIVTKKVVVRGWPACIFCSAKDESNWPTWPEIVSRFLITSPNMIQKKYEESNSLTAQTKSLPSFIKQHVIISDSEIELAKKCVRHLIRQLQTNNHELWIPYGEYLGEALKAEKGTDSRAAKRIFSFLNVIPLVKADLRPKLTITKNHITMTVATLEDLNEALSITQNYAGIPTNKMDFFKYDLYRLYKTEKLNEDGLTTKEMSEAHKLRTGRSMNSDAIRKSLLYELMNNGYVEEEDSAIDKRRKIYRPLLEPELDPEKNKEIAGINQSPQFITTFSNNTT
ncbi:MAG: hypothetical protein E6K97_04940 [Thaumarchaeota archaeon]|nr:MAG: hypothetical protein E6K97_04940 [Nitrososphaerota archaeon]